MYFQSLRSFVVFSVFAWPLLTSHPALADDRETLHALTTVKAEGAENSRIAKDDWLSQFYHDSNYRPVWTESRRARKRLAAYLELLDASSTLGFDPEVYGLSYLRKLEDRLGKDNRARLELEASRSFAEFALDTRNGRISPRIDFTQDELAGRDRDKASLLKGVRESKSPKKFIAALRRDNPAQARLIQALANYTRLQRDGGWKTINIETDLLEVGDTGPGVERIAERLRAEGFFKADVAYKEIKPEGAASTDPAPAETASETTTPVALYDTALSEAVEAFQVSRGIEPDGIVGANTLERMNVPVEALIENIRLNLERARWLPQDFADRHVLVNIAAYSAGLYENERLQSKIRTVVGKYHQQTPVFAGSMSYIVANPYWNIPESIVRNEIVPKMQEDGSYLTRKNMEIVSGWEDEPEIIDPENINWADLPEPLGFRIRQRPGESNSLGLVKFMFPNDYSVYLHDTPADALFDETKRAFSHGCIRLADPMKFAGWVLEETQEYDRKRVEEIITEGEQTVIQLDEEIPVYITYFTAWAEKNGTVFFFDDVYKRDTKLKNAIERSRHDYGGGGVSALN